MQKHTNHLQSVLSSHKNMHCVPAEMRIWYPPSLPDMDSRIDSQDTKNLLIPPNNSISGCKM